MSDILKDIEGLSEKKRALLELLLKEKKEAQSRVIPRRQQLSFYPLSFAQQRLWFLDRLMQGGHSYNIHFSERLKGLLNVEALRYSLNEVVRRHEPLRTTFTTADGQPVQMIAPSLHLNLLLIDLTDLSEAVRMGEMRRLATEDAKTPFDLERGPLLRAALVKLTSDEHVLLLTTHHTVCDGWSTELLVREMATFYEAYSTGANNPLPELAIQYADFAVWQREWLQGEVLENLLRYWKGQLDSPVPVLQLPTDKSRPAIQAFDGGTQSVKLSHALTESLLALSHREGVTFFMTMLAVFKILLFKYSGQTDIVVGTPIANRNHTETQSLIGVFINMLALRTDLSGNPRFRELLGRVRKVSLESYAHQDLPFEKLVEELQPERDVSRHPLFQVMLVMQSASDEALQLPGLRLTPLPVETGTAQFDLTLAILEGTEGLLLSFDYRADLFNDSTITRMTKHFQMLLEQVVADAGQRLSDLSLLTDSETRHLLIEWNHTRVDYADASFIQLFESQVERTPESCAVVSGRDRLSYRELNGRANQLAHHLRKLGVGPDVLVGLYVESTVELMVGLVGILKAGGAYVPLDPANPKLRLADALEDAKMPIIVTLKSLADNLAQSRVHPTYLDADWPIIAHESEENLISETPPESLAYVIYTSGSTGRAKGVAVEHRQLFNYINSIVDRVDFPSGANFATVSTVAADLSNTVIFPALCTGGCLHVISRDQASDSNSLSEYFRSHAIDCLKVVPTHLAILLAASDCGPVIPRRRLVLGGEACSWSLVEKIRALDSNCKIINHYGPTETTVGVLTYEVGEARGEQRPPSVPIGRPLNNTQIYLMDQYLQPVATGIPGELYIGGAGVARGYLNRADLTAERFIPNQFSNVPGARLYRTGDLARYLPDGNIEFLGRIDQQVKIRGFRIEPGEIESVLRQHPLVEDVVVLAREDEPGDKRLVAYTVAKQERLSGINEIRSFLKEKLPDYMIPSAFVFLNALPLTSQGKLNRKALPAPEAHRPDLDENYTPPRNEVERMIAGVWQEVLRVEGAGVNDNFFDLGGHSLLLAQVHSKLRNLFAKNISMLDLFRYPTISSLAGYISPPLTDSIGVTERQERLESDATALTQGDADIAIIGMAGRFPGAKSVEEFWKNLRDGVESISFFSEEELEASGVSPELMNDPSYVKAGAVLDDIDMFDASFFGFNPREAEITDPQHRLFLECAYNTLESAGYNPENSGQVVGLYAGVSMATYWMNLFSNPDVVESVTYLQTKIANDKDHLTTRVSYKLNLKGPSVAVQTTCSSSLVAVHIACRSLLNGECDMALAGGVSIPIPQKEGYLYQEGGIQSPDGHCRAFDAKAQGVVAGSGVALVALKRLKQALADGDNILAVIKGTAINNDGSSKVGYTAPSVQGQADVIAKAQAVAGVDPETISYVEAHGTGTLLGDPIEMAALSQVFRAKTDKRNFCAVGSVKTNIGHLDTAAGVAGLIKTVMALKHKILPPSLHFDSPNPKIDFDSSPFYVNAKLARWSTDALPRRAGVSSYGIGGTNAHAVLEEAPEREAATRTGSTELLLLSAKTQTALEQITDNLAEYLKEHQDVSLAEVAYTLQVGRKAFNNRRAVVCGDVETAVSALGDADPKRVFTSECEPGRKHIVFMFPGQGAQYVNMGRELYTSEPTYRDHIDDCSAMLEPHIGFNLKSLLYPEESGGEQAGRQLDQTHLTQPALFVVEYSLAKLWAKWGVHPHSMIGHSIGEYVAACLAGVLSLEEALKLVAARGRLIQSLPAGSMLSVPLPAEQVQALLGDNLALAAINGPSLCAVSGPVECIDELQSRLSQQRIKCRPLHTSHAFHSQMLEPIIEPFTEVVKSVKLKAPKIDYISNVTGTWVTAAEATDPVYWANHMRQTVRFESGVRELLINPDSLFLEIGPGHTLCALTRQHPGRNRQQPVIASMRHAQDDTPDREFLLKSLGRLWGAGVNIDWGAFNAGARRYRVALPTYPFERQRYWVERKKNEFAGEAGHTKPRKKAKIADWFYAPSWKRSAAREASKQNDEPGAQTTWVLFVDACGLGAQIVKRIKQQDQDVMTVAMGEQFEKVGSQAYTVNLRRKEDYQKLIDELHGLGKSVTKIVHLWGITVDEEARDSFDRAQDQGFYSLVYLSQALAKRNIIEPIEIIVVSNNIQEVTGQERLCPDKATILGPLKVIPQESPHIRCRNIDIELEDPGSKREEYLIEDLLTEITSTTPDLIVAYRGGYRWTQQFEALRLGSGPDGGSLLKPGGLYVITGGLGRIGLTLAEHLALTKGAKVILIARTSLPGRDMRGEYLTKFGEAGPLSIKIRRLEKLEELGAVIGVMQADVADERQMAEAIRQIYESYGRIDGLIHAAGVVGETIFTNDLSYEEGQRQFHAKARGAKVLKKVLEGREAGFCLLASSISSLLGGLGFASYAASNNFMDAFAQEQNRLNHMKWISVNWDAWQFEDSFDQERNVGMSLAELSLWPQEGMQAFEQILSANRLSQVIVSTSDLQSRIDQWVNLESLRSEHRDEIGGAPRSHPRNVTVEYVAPGNEAEQTITEIWQRLLGVDRVGIHDDFFELGGHSLLAIQLFSHLRTIFSVELQMQALFSSPTVATLARAIERAKTHDGKPVITEITPVSREAYRVNALLRDNQITRIKGPK